MDIDVAVVGASTSGLLAAFRLAEQGRQVAVYEKNAALDANRRTYIVTPAVRRVLPDLDLELILNEITRMEVEAEGSIGAIPLQSPDLIIERIQLRQSLLQKAREAGVKIKMDRKFIRLESENGEMNLVFYGPEGQEEIAAGTIIGADGVHSRVREGLGLDPVPAVPLLQAEVPLPDDWDPRVTKVWFAPQETPYFYWLIPESESRAVVGLIAEQGADIRGLLNGFLEDHGFQALDYQSGTAALHTRDIQTRLDLPGGTVYLVGDAAGQVKVTTVGGTVTGFRGAEAAVEQILEGSGMTRAGKQLRQELGLHVWIRWMLERMNAEDYRWMIELLSPPVQEFLAVHDRDAMRRQFWKLAVLQPGFIPLGLKLLLGLSRGKTPISPNKFV